jgi:selenoprotein W-related protein
VRAVTDLLRTYQHVIEELLVVPGRGGVFDVRVDGELLFSKKQAGRHAQPGEVLELFRQHVGSSVPEYER